MKPRLRFDARSLSQLSITMKRPARLTPVVTRAANHGQKSIDQRQDQRRGDGKGDQRGEGADVAGAQDEIRRQQAAGDEAEIIGRAEEADLDRAEALRSCPQRHGREQKAVAREQERDADQ